MSAPDRLLILFHVYIRVLELLSSSGPSSSPSRRSCGIHETRAVSTAGSNNWGCTVRPCNKYTSRRSFVLVHCLMARILPSPKTLPSVLSVVFHRLVPALRWCFRDPAVEMRRPSGSFSYFAFKTRRESNYEETTRGTPAVGPTETRAESLGKEKVYAILSKREVFLDDCRAMMRPFLARPLAYYSPRFPEMELHFTQFFRPARDYETLHRETLWLNAWIMNDRRIYPIHAKANINGINSVKTTSYPFRRQVLSLDKRYSPGNTTPIPVRWHACP